MGRSGDGEGKTFIGFFSSVGCDAFVVLLMKTHLFRRTPPHYFINGNASSALLLLLLLDHPYKDQSHELMSTPVMGLTRYRRALTTMHISKILSLVAVCQQLPGDPPLLLVFQ